jgi:hypothetical protein
MDASASTTTPSNPTTTYISKPLTCSFCQKIGNDPTSHHLGPLIGPYDVKNNILYFHLYCLYFSWDIWIDCTSKSHQKFHQNYFILPDLAKLQLLSANLNSNMIENENHVDDMILLLQNLKNVHSNYSRTHFNKCNICNRARATVACSISKCSSQYHFPCAQNHVKFFYCSMAFILVSKTSVFCSHLHRRKGVMVWLGHAALFSVIVTPNGKVNGKKFLII